jgi:hypothetical protein
MRIFIEFFEKKKSRKMDTLMAANFQVISQLKYTVYSARHFLTHYSRIQPNPHKVMNLGNVFHGVCMFGKKWIYKTTTKLHWVVVKNASTFSSE